jgi:hypothetical protein
LPVTRNELVSLRIRTRLGLGLFLTSSFAPNVLLTISNHDTGSGLSVLGFEDTTNATIVQHVPNPIPIRIVHPFDDICVRGPA